MFRKNYAQKIAKATTLGVGRPLPKDTTAEDSPDTEWAGRNVIDGESVSLSTASEPLTRACSPMDQEHQHDISVIAGDVEKVRLKAPASLYATRRIF